MPNSMAPNDYKVVLEHQVMIILHIQSLRSSNIVTLRSDRTLRDYTHFIKAQTGFNYQVDHQLKKEANLDSVTDFKRFVCLVFDEVKVKEDLIYDKHSGELIGFVDVGEISMSRCA